MSEDKISKLEISQPEIKMIEKPKTEERRFEEFPRPSEVQKKPEQIIKEAAKEGEFGAIPSAGQIQREKEQEVQIEKILASGVEDAYLKMPEDKKREFKKVGEETAQKINEILNKGKVKVWKIVELIRKWLSLIPGVNKFFLEQEAKIKTDKIMKIKR